MSELPQKPQLNIGAVSGSALIAEFLGSKLIFNHKPLHELYTGL